MGMLEPVVMEVGQEVVMRMSAELAPRSDLASSSVWKGVYLSLEMPAVMVSSSWPPRQTILMPSEVVRVVRLPR